MEYYWRNKMQFVPLDSRMIFEKPGVQRQCWLFNKLLFWSEKRDNNCYLTCVIPLSLLTGLFLSLLMDQMFTDEWCEILAKQTIILNPFKIAPFHQFECNFMPVYKAYSLQEHVHCWYESFWNCPLFLFWFSKWVFFSLSASVELVYERQHISEAHLPGWSGIMCGDIISKKILHISYDRCAFLASMGRISSSHFAAGWRSSCAMLLISERFSFMIWIWLSL